MRRAVLLGLGITALGLAPAAVAKPRDGVPRWVAASEQRAVARLFGKQTVVGVFHIPYRQKIAVVVQFQDVAVCRICSAPSNAARPRGRVVRFSFDRRTHQLNGMLRFCEVQAATPPLAACLAR